MTVENKLTALWQDYLDENSQSLLPVWNPTDSVLQQFKSNRLITQEEYQNLTSIGEAQALRRSNQLFDLMYGGSDRFATRDKITTMLKIFEHKDYRRPMAAKIFQKFMDEHLEDDDEENSKVEADKKTKKAVTGGTTYLTKMSGNSKIGAKFEGDTTIKGDFNLDMSESHTSER